MDKTMGFGGVDGRADRSDSPKEREISGIKAWRGAMLLRYLIHNRFQENTETFEREDPHLIALHRLKLQHAADWWKQLSLETPGIYILTGGRQIGKSTSCKLLILHCLKKNLFSDKQIFYLPCDEVFDARELSATLRAFLDQVPTGPFLLIVDEITFVKEWDRVIKGLADEGYFRRGVCLLTRSDTLILKEAAMRFPGRRGTAAQTDFHLYPLSFADYVMLRAPKTDPSNKELSVLFDDYLVSGGYLRAINDLEEGGELSSSTLQTYEQWIRGDFLKQNKSEETLIQILRALLTIGVSPMSYSALTQKIGLVSKETCIDYCRLLNRMDVLLDLQAFDPVKRIGFPRKARKFHFSDPFIYRTFLHWLQREGFLQTFAFDSMLVEACVASHCHRYGKTFYFKGQGEVDLIWLHNNTVRAIEVKWSKKLRSSDLKMLKQFPKSLILRKSPDEGVFENIESLPVYRFLFNL